MGTPSDRNSSLPVNPPPHPPNTHTASQCHTCKWEAACCCGECLGWVCSHCLALGQHDGHPIRQEQPRNFQTLRHKTTPAGTSHACVVSQSSKSPMAPYSWSSSRAYTPGHAPMRTTTRKRIKTHAPSTATQHTHHQPLMGRNHTPVVSQVQHNFRRPLLL